MDFRICTSCVTTLKERSFELKWVELWLATCSDCGHTHSLFIVFPIRILGSCLCTENMTLSHTFASSLCSMTAGLFLLMQFSSTKELWLSAREKSPGLSFYVSGVTFTHESLPICQKITAQVRLHSRKYMCSVISGVVLLDRGKTLDFLPLIWLTASIVSF